MPPQSDTTIPAARPTTPAAPPTTATITRTVTVAAGVFAPGHLGELTRYLPFELVDDVLAQTRTVQRRLRALPSRTGMYFVLALGLFPQIGHARVWAKLCAGLTGLAVPVVSEKALRELRRRLGPAPFKALFEVVAGPLAQPRTPGTCFAGMRTVAFDGLNSLKVPDTDRNRGWMGRIRYRMGFAGYPTLRLMCLAETGTRGLLGAADDRDETTLAVRLLPLLGPGMLVLLDRGFDSAAFLGAVHHTGAMLLARGRSQRVPPVLAHLTDADPQAQHAHPARRMGPPRVPHPHPRRQLRPRRPAPAVARRPFPGPFPAQWPTRTARGTGQGAAPAAQRGRTTLRREEHRPQSPRPGKRHADPNHLPDLHADHLTPRHWSPKAMRSTLDSGVRPEAKGRQAPPAGRPPAVPWPARP